MHKGQRSDYLNICLFGLRVTVQYKLVLNRRTLVFLSIIQYGDSYCSLNKSVNGYLPFIMTQLQMKKHVPKLKQKLIVLPLNRTIVKTESTDRKIMCLHLNNCRTVLKLNTNNMEFGHS